MHTTVHDTLACGIEYGVAPMPERHLVAFQIRMLAGACSDPEPKLGLAHIVEQTIDMGTAKRDARALSDAFDAIGAVHRAAVGRETTTFSCAVLPEHFETAMALHAEMLRTPTFPEDRVVVAIDLAKQDLVALEDDAPALADKRLSRLVFGPILGRHPLGEQSTLETLTREDVVEHWRSYFHAGRMIVTIAGPIDDARAAHILAEHFDGFGQAAPAGRTPFKVEFKASTTHHDKPLEQEQIGIAWPGVCATHDDFPIQQVVLGILSGGMSGRLFTEIREKQGLVYWVAAWQDTPRGAGMIFVGASTKPDRCDKTCATLLHEVDRLADDVTSDELERAIVGIVAADETRGDSTRARCAELAGDIFHFGKPIPTDEKIAKIEAVTIEDVKRYLTDYPRDQLCVLTLGPRPLSTATAAC
ncbi:MAG: insulinase family protein [Planctomycetes bacterium]|nr:insulinase family protein [Planctomycetota bacterium]